MPMTDHLGLNSLYGSSSRRTQNPYLSAVLTASRSSSSSGTMWNFVNFTQKFLSHKPLTSNHAED